MCVGVINSCDLNKIAYLCKKESMSRNCDACGNEYQVNEANLLCVYKCLLINQVGRGHPISAFLLR